MERSPIPVDQLLAELPRVQRLARVLVGDGLADDLAQQAMLVALEHGPRRPGHSGPWLRGVARNLARVSRRTAKRRQATSIDPADLGISHGPSEEVERAEGLELLARAIQSLHENDRDLIVARFFDDESPARIAARQGELTSTVRSRISRAVAKLRRQMSGAPEGRGLSAIVGLAALPDGAQGAVLAQSEFSRAVEAKSVGVATVAVPLAVIGAVVAGALYLPQLERLTLGSAGGGEVEMTNSSSRQTVGAMHPDEEVAVGGGVASVSHEPVVSTGLVGPAAESQADLTSIRRDVAGVARGETRTITVRAIGIDGDPAAGVGLAAMDVSSGESSLVYQSASLKAHLPPARFLFPAARTNADGVARVLVPATGVGAVLCVDDGWIASGPVVTLETEVLELQVTRAWPVAAHITDSDGRPAANVFVQLQMGPRDQLSNRLGPAKIVTDKDGVADLLVTGWDLRRASDSGQRLFAVAQLLKELVAEPIRLEEGKPPEQVVLQLPASGSVLVALPEGVPSPGRATLARTDDMGIDRFFSARRFDNGTVLFPHVEIGLGELVLQTQSDGESGERKFSVRGPMRAGEQVALAPQLGGVFSLSGRLVDETGTPYQVPSKASPGFGTPSIMVHLVGTKLHLGTNLKVDEEGYFQVLVDSEQVGLPLARIVIECDREKAIVDMSDFSGAFDRNLGDVRMGSGPVLVSGSILSPDGRPLEQASIRVQSLRSVWRNGVENWSDEYDCKPIFDHGEFRIPDERSAGEKQGWRIMVAHPEFRLSQPVSFVPGQSGLTVRLSEAGGLKGTVRVPDGFRARELAYALVVHGDQSDLGPGGGARLPDGVAWKVEADADRLNFLASAVEPGEYDLHFRVNRLAGSVHVVEGIKVLPGEISEDPRLGNLDASLWIRSIGIEILLPDGSPPERPRIVEVRDDGWASLDVRAVGIGKWSIVAGRNAPLDLGVLVPGYSPIRDRDVQDGAIFRLVKRRSVRLRIAGEQPIEFPGGPLRLDVWRLDQNGKRAFADFRDENIVSWDGRFVSFPADGPGRYELRWVAPLGDNGAGPRVAIEKMTLDLAESDFGSEVSIQLPPGLWDGAQG